MDSGTLIFKLEQATFQYDGGHAALNGVDLRVRRGECLAVLGANGCGKSTLLSILDGLLFPQIGSFEAFGFPVTEEQLSREDFGREFRSRVALVFQNSDVQLFCPSVWEELSFGPLQLGLAKEDILERNRDVMALLGIGHLADRAPFGLSGGEKKKVAIASVLTMNPEALLLDEPGNGLDPRTLGWLIEFLLQLKETGKTIVVATHDLSLVDEVAERVVVLDESHAVAAEGSVAGILGDQELLLRANLIHEHSHLHNGVLHRHLHSHSGGHRHEHSKRP